MNPGVAQRIMSLKTGSCPLSMNLQPPESPLTPALSPSAGESEDTWQVVGMPEAAGGCGELGDCHGDASKTDPLTQG